jgi:hypothetical protein
MSGKSNINIEELEELWGNSNQSAFYNGVSNPLSNIDLNSKLIL